MNAEYKKAAKKLLCGITDKRLHEPTIWNDILSSACSGKLRLWEINNSLILFANISCCFDLSSAQIASAAFLKETSSFISPGFFEKTD